MRRWLVMGLLGVLCLSAWVRAEQNPEIIDKPAGTEPEYDAYLQKKSQNREELKKQRQQLEDEYNATMAKLKAKREELSQLKTDKVTIDEETKDVKEPNSSEAALEMEQGRRVRDAYEISPDDFAISDHDRWSINLSDFKFDAPQYIVRDIKYGAAKKWFGFTFSITNTTSKKRRITPMFTAVTSKGVFNQATGGFLPERALADSTFHPLADSSEISDKELLNEGVPPLESSLRLASHALDSAKGAAQDRKSTRLNSSH